MPPIRSLLAAMLALASLSALAQSPVVRWAVSAYGPAGAAATVGCGTCASDQRAMAVDAAGNVFVTGFAATATASDILTVKFDAVTGAESWRQVYDAGLGAHEQAWALALDPAGNVVVTGYSYTGAEYDITTIKYAGADGTELWRRTFTGPSSGIDFGIAIGTDGAGNVFVGGNVWNGLNDDLKIIKFAAVDGAVLWDKTFAGAAGFNDYAFALGVDGAGNVIVAGEEQQSGADSDWKIVKYAAADGATLWQRSFAGAAGGLDIPFSVAIDGAGHAIVAGNTHNGTNFDARVAKYASSDGAMLWEKTFAGADGGDDMFYGLALGPQGDAYVAGFTFTTAGSNDWNVARYAAADGALVWRRAVAGSGNLSDVAVAIAVDAQGDAIAGGRINDSSDPANRDLHVVRFAAADGAPRWSYTHAGGAGGFDRAAAVAVRGGAVFFAGESLETGAQAGWRVARLEEAPVTFALAVAKAGAGGGTVASTPAGIDCGATCASSFVSGTVVSLAATPAAGSIFAGWGGACSGTGACSVTMDAARSVTATFTLETSIPRLVNLSTRVPVRTGNDVMIGGFIIGGTQPKTVVVRARGPSLAQAGVAGALANPQLQLFSGPTAIGFNDDWGQAANAAALSSSGYAPAHPQESALLAILAPGAYTAIVSGVGGAAGVGIVEVFELDRPAVPLANISTRGVVLTGGDVMIGGFVIQGDAPQTVVVRARGPSLAAAVVTGVLANPLLQLFSGSTQVAVNDNWQSAANAQALQSSGFAPPDPLESAILVTLAPGAYTAIVTGAGGATGVGIIEVFAQ